MRNGKAKELSDWRVLLVPLAGLEPARSLNRGILSPLRLPIPPQRQVFRGRELNSLAVFLCKALHRLVQGFLEAPPGFEPGDKGFADLGLTTWL